MISCGLVRRGAMAVIRFGQSARAALSRSWRYDKMKVEVSRSERAGKKWKAQLPSGKAVHFGATPYQDFTQHGAAKALASKGLQVSIR